MKRNIKLNIVFTVMLAVLFFSLGDSDLLAKKKRLRFQKPDLEIVKITVNKNCNVVVVVRNNGPGKIPATVWTKPHPKTASVMIHVNGKSWGGQTLPGFDPGRKLMRPGGKARYVSRYKVTKPVRIKAVVDTWNDVKESNERNNTRIKKRLKCGGDMGGSYGPKMPDLIVKDIQLTKNCKIQVTLKNIGSAGVPAHYYNLPKAVGVQMYKGGKPWGGLILSGFDPMGKLKSPGGTATHIWFPKAGNLNLSPGLHSVRVVVDHLKVMPELNENNNQLTRRLNCQARIKPGFSTQPVTTVKPGLMGQLVVKAPNRFFLDFNNGYLAYKKSSKSIQVIMDSNVISYGKDWEKCQLNSYLYHIRQKVWKGFYWQVNTSKKEVYKVTGGSFCEMGGKHQKLNMTVDDNAGFFYLRFPKSYIVYSVATKTLQAATENMVLSYGNDFKKCQVNNVLYQLRGAFWSAFFWEINTLKKKAYRVTNGTFCKPGGNKTKLNATVRVVN